LINSVTSTGLGDTFRRGNSAGTPEVRTEPHVGIVTHDFETDVPIRSKKV
jgi:hypothetical protein